jgi:hypothetical protein
MKLRRQIPDPPITAQPTPRADRLEAAEVPLYKARDLRNVPLDKAIQRLFR